MDARTRREWERRIRGAQHSLRRAARQVSRRLVIACTLAVLVTLLVPANGAGLGLAGILTAQAKAPKPSHTPTTSSAFQKAAVSAKQHQGTPKWLQVHMAGPRVYSGLTPAAALPSTGKVRNHAASVHLDAPFLRGPGRNTDMVHWYKSSEGVLELGVPEGALDLSGVTGTTSAPTTSTPSPTSTPEPVPSPTSPSSIVPTATPATPATQASPVTSAAKQSARTTNGARVAQVAQVQQIAQVQTDTPPSYSLDLEPTDGTFQGDALDLGTYTLQVVDDQGNPVEGAVLDEPVEVVFNYSAGELDTLNPESFMLSWPQTGDEATDTTAAAVPVTLDPDAQTLTASVATLQPGPMVLSATIADANQASSEHLTDDGNQGDVGFSVPLDLPPAAGGLVPPLQMVYSSGGPNNRHSRQAPAPWVGDGWDLSLGSITADFSTGHYYLTGVGGVSEPLLCCMTDDAGVKYFVPHHHPEIRIYTTDNTTTPSSDTTAAAFTVLTPDGMEYRMGWKYGGSSNPYAVFGNALRATVSGGVRRVYEWDVAEVVKRSSAAGANSFLQKYTVAYWHDNSTNSSITYQRDAALEEVDYNYDTSGVAHARVLFNIHGPSGTVKSGGGDGTLTAYPSTTDYNCASSPYQSIHLRCDDPGTPSGWEAAPLTMTTLTLDQMVVQVTDSSGAWQNVRTYTLSYNPDDPWKLCWDGMTGQNIGCSGEHLLHAITETPYQGSTAKPSRQPMIFHYTGFVKNEYHDITVTDGSGNPFDSQAWWKYLSSFTDGQTGAGASITWATAYGNTHGVPSGHSVDNPLTCDSVTCTNADDRQWPHQVVTALTDNGNGTTTNYSYQLSETCGSGCTQDTWIPPNAWNACGDSGLPPHNPNQACLTTTYADYYKEEYTGFAVVTATHPDSSSTVTQYWAGNGWGTNDWDDANRLRGMPTTTLQYAGAPSGNPLRQVDESYSDNSGVNCPATSGTTQLYQNPYLLCLVYPTQQVTTFREGYSSGTTVPTLTETWSYTVSDLGTNRFQLRMFRDSVTGNDLIADAYPTRTTTPTFNTDYAYTWNDQTSAFSGGHPGNYFHYFGLPAQVILSDDQGNHWACSQTRYDGLAYGTGQQNSLLYGLPTYVTGYGDCGTSGNGYTLSGGVMTASGFDGYGQPLVTTDADAFASIAGHVGCPASVTPLVVGHLAGQTTYTSCTTYDSVQHAYKTTTANALNQQTTASYDVVQGVQTALTDPNGQVTTTPAPVYEYSGTTLDLAHYQDAYVDTKLPGEAASWTTRTFAFSFCTNSSGTFLSGTAPCLEVDRVQQFDGTNLTVSRAFYDREGRLVETRASGPDSSHDVVTFTSYDDVNDKVFSSLPCTVAALSTSNGGRSVTSTAIYIAPAAISTGSGAYIDPTVSGTSCYNSAGSVTYYDTLRRVIASDDTLGTGAGTSGTGCLVGSLHHTTCAYYQVAQASTSYGMPSSDTAVYLRTVASDANLHQSARYTDALGRAAYGVTFTGSGQSPLSGVSYYATVANHYDPVGNLRIITQPDGSQTTSTDDKLGRMTATSDPDLGAWSYTYDANGNLRSSTDPRGSSGGGVVYTNYDGLNRQLWRNTSDTSSGAYVTYSYDSTASGNKGVGRLTGESFTGGTSSHVLSGSYGFTYDVRGQLTQQTLTTESSTNYALSYLYNDAGMPTSLTYSDGEVLRNAYGTSGWLSAVTTTPSGGSAVNLLTNLSYGGPSLQLTGASQGNGTYTFAASYDNDGRQTNSQLTSDSSVVFASARTYDAAGNITGVNTTLPDGMDNQAFCYDALDRLVWAGSTGSPSCGSSLSAGSLTSAQYTQTFAYDTLDRLTSISSSGATGGSPGSYTYGDSTHLHAATSTVGGYSASYDAAGDMLCRAPTSATTCTSGSPTGAQLAYDAERRLTHYQNIPGAFPDVEAWDLYDGAGNRVEQAVNQSGVTTSTYYLAGGAEEVRSDGSLVKYYNGLGLNTGATASTIAYLASDGLGSLQVMLNNSGSATAEQLNAPYGSVRFSSGVFPTTKGFTGQRTDAAVSGLDYYGARYYDPALGQFTSADSAAAGFNRYSYVGGNPETLTDPTGHRACIASDCRSGEGEIDHHGTRHVSTAKCTGYCKKIHDIFHDARTQDVLMTLLSSPTGRTFIDFLLFAGALFGGDKFIVWTKRAFSNPTSIEMDADGLQGDWTKEDLIREAGSLIHETLEVYLGLAEGLTNNSQHLDYLAQVFGGQVKKELAIILGANFGKDESYGAYGMTFNYWIDTPEGMQYLVYDKDQKELTNPLWYIAKEQAQKWNSCGPCLGLGASVGIIQWPHVSSVNVWVLAADPDYVVTPNFPPDHDGPRDTA